MPKFAMPNIFLILMLLLRLMRSTWLSDVKHTTLLAIYLFFIAQAIRGICAHMYGNSAAYLEHNLKTTLDILRDNNAPLSGIHITYSVFICYSARCKMFKQSFCWEKMGILREIIIIIIAWCRTDVVVKYRNLFCIFYKNLHSEQWIFDFPVFAYLLFGCVKLLWISGFCFYCFGATHWFVKW